MTQHEGARAYCRNLWLKPFCTPSLGTSKGQIRTDCNISYLESAGGGGRGERVAGGHRRASGRVFAMR